MGRTYCQNGRCQLGAEHDGPCEPQTSEQLERDQLRAEVELLSVSRQNLADEVERLREERRALLGVKTTEGLTASEWMLRTSLAESQLRELREAVEVLRNDIANATSSLWDRETLVHELEAVLAKVKP